MGACHAHALTHAMGACHAQVFTPPHKVEAIRYLRNHQNEDGGYGLHIEGSSTMFGTALRWEQLRLCARTPP